MSEPIRLAEWIAALRRELTEAVRWQEGRTAAHQAEAVPMLLPSLKLKELKLEVELTSRREDISQNEARIGAKASGKAPIAFFVVSGELSGEVSASRDRHRLSESTQRVTLILEPGDPSRPILLGDDREKELLGAEQ